MPSLRPMKGVAVDFNKLRISEHEPMFMSPKLDGIRALVVNGVVMSNTLKPIRNRYVQELFGSHIFDGFDGELIVGDPTAPDSYRRTSSGVMSAAGRPEVTFHAFDWLKRKNVGFKYRYYDLAELFETQRLTWGGHFELVPHRRVTSVEQINAVTDDWLEKGFEGSILRDPEAVYKFGRSTMNEQGLLKIKKWEDGEAVIVDAYEMLLNENMPTRDALGYQVRSAHKGNKRASGMLGAVVVKCLKTGLTFKVGSGFDHETRLRLWAMREQLVGQIIRYKWFAIGNYDVPRHPIFTGFRHPEDLSL